MKLFMTFALSFMAGLAYASEPVKLEDLVGTWQEDNTYQSLEDDKSFSITFDSSGNGVIENANDIKCPKSAVKYIDGVFHISCFYKEEFEIIKLVLAGWKSKKKTVIFGFRYWLQDIDRILGNHVNDDPKNYTIYGGVPASLVKLND